ncbi:hypothetical protein BDM02DRAFT_3132772 [Thelephora ganbajun]|uniref:Uncharacterized protein n=1 Tax=Thelephora ganbajun TaxID=370292 RepID=A0ACB6Z0D3_THEGA|nr:hypothetical protein BDM02DRAFT_3132772 [Thelephora ganbajun]
MAPRTKRQRPAEDAPAPHRSRQPLAPSPNQDLYQDTTDRSLIDKPVHAHIHVKMSNTWELFQYFLMCILFNVVNPLRQFKKGTVFNKDDDDPYPEYNPRDSGDVTELDADGTLQPYKPMDHMYILLVSSIRLFLLTLVGVTSPRYRFDCAITVKSFMNWTEGQLKEITYSKARKRPKKWGYMWTMKTRKIPVPYVWIAHQFIFEDAHGKVDMGHESLCRWTYAQCMLDEFGRELNAFQGQESEFRLKVFTPVLQRQLKGVPNTYGPSIQSAISPHDGKPTISQVTTFYLGNNPLDPRCILSYQQNLIYTHEAMWHLVVLMGRATHKSKKAFRSSLDTHNIIMGALTLSSPQVTRGVPLFSDLEVTTIASEEIEEFFDSKLKRVPDALAMALEAREIDQAQQPATIFQAVHLRTAAACVVKVSGHHPIGSGSTSDDKGSEEDSSKGQGSNGNGSDGSDGNSGNGNGNDGDDGDEGDSDDSDEGDGDGE